jgi:hypothetical protein
MILKLKMHLQHQEGSMTKKIILFAAVGGLALVASALTLPCWAQEDVGEGIARGVIEGLGDGRRGDHDRNRPHEDDRDWDNDRHHEGDRDRRRERDDD